MSSIKISISFFLQENKYYMCDDKWQLHMALVLGYRREIGLAANKRMHATHRLMVTIEAPAVTATFPAARRKWRRGRKVKDFKKHSDPPTPCAYISHWLSLLRRLGNIILYLGTLPPTPLI